MEETTTRSKKPFIVGLVLLLVFAAAYALVLYAFNKEGENRAAGLSANDKIGNIVSMPPPELSPPIR
jgi:hypothetical protein